MIDEETVEKEAKDYIKKEFPEIPDSVAFILAKILGSIAVIEGTLEVMTQTFILIDRRISRLEETKATRTRKDSSNER